MSLYDIILLSTELLKSFFFQNKFYAFNTFTCMCQTECLLFNKIYHMPTSAKLHGSILYHILCMLLNDAVVFAVNSAIFQGQTYVPISLTKQTTLKG